MGEAFIRGVFQHSVRWCHDVCAAWNNAYVIIDLPNGVSKTMFFAVYFSLFVVLCYSFVTIGADSWVAIERLAQMFQCFLQKFWF